MSFSTRILLFLKYIIIMMELEESDYVDKRNMFFIGKFPLFDINY
jgi:hypothetical protein